MCPSWVWTNDIGPHDAKIAIAERIARTASAAPLDSANRIRVLSSTDKLHAGVARNRRPHVAKQSMV
jgi:hypothetical protein